MLNMPAPSNALLVSAAEEFGPLFAVLDKPEPNRKVLDLEGCDCDFVAWRLFEEVNEGIVLRDGVQYWTEQTLWVPRRTPSCSFALRYRGREYEFVRVIARRHYLSSPEDETRSKPRRIRTAA